MNGYLGVSLGAALAAASGLAASRWLGLTLRPVLVELCGSPARAAFWLAFTDLILVLAPVAFALMWGEVGRPTDASTLYSQLRAALWGLMLAAGGLGLTLSRFAARGEPR